MYTTWKASQRRRGREHRRCGGLLLSDRLHVVPSVRICSISTCSCAARARYATAAPVEINDMVLIDLALHLAGHVVDRAPR